MSGALGALHGGDDAHGTRFCTVKDRMPRAGVPDQAAVSSVIGMAIGIVPFMRDTRSEGAQAEFHGAAH